MTPQQLIKPQQLVRQVGPQELHVGKGTTSVFNEHGILVAHCNTPATAELVAWLANNAPALIEAAGIGSAP